MHHFLTNNKQRYTTNLATKLNNQQLSLEASIRMIAEMRSLSLLNVL